MRTFLQLFAVVALVFVGTACSEDSGEPMGHKLEEIEEKANTLTDLAAPHKLVIDNAADLSATVAEELTYGTNADAAFEAMEHAVEELMECKHGDVNMDITAMNGVLDEVSDELAAHKLAMANAADLQAAVAEETRHQTEMARIFGDMWAEHTNMTTVADDYMCGGDHHD